MCIFGLKESKRSFSKKRGRTEIRFASFVRDELMFSKYKPISSTGKVNKIGRTGWEGGRKMPCAAEGSHAE